MVFNPMIWTADQLIMLRQIFTDLTNEFWILDMPQRGHQGFTGAVLVADLTKNLIFRPFGPPEWS